MEEDLNRRPDPLKDPNRPAEPLEVTPGRARQGTSSPRILILLVVSLVLLLFAWWGLDIYRGAELQDDTDIETTTTAPQPAQPSSPVLPDESLQRGDEPPQPAAPEGATE